MCLLALLVIGAVSYNKIRLQAFPSGLEWKRLWVWMGTGDSSPQENDQQFARLFEEHLSTVKGLRRFRTWAGRGWTNASLRFRSGTDMKLAYNQVADRLDRMKAEIPEEYRDNLGVWNYNEDTDQEIIWMAVALPEGEEEPQRFVEDYVQRRLERLDGVARVRFGGRW